MNISLNMLTNLGIMILAGIFMGRLMKHLGFPNVTGYMLAGLLLGPYLLWNDPNARPAHPCAAEETWA